MDATSSPSRAKNNLLSELKSLYPAITFTEGRTFSYSGAENTVFYPKGVRDKDTFIYSLLHEIGHAELMHNNFKNDLELIILERDAWEKSKEIGQKISIVVSDDHIEACMDSYRDWLYARSLCPHCNQCGIQTQQTAYSCPFCRNTWKVSASRLCKVTRHSSVKK